MKTVSVYFSLGTNQGDRAAQIDEALRRLDAAIGRHYEALSSIIETPSWGFEGPDFLNCVVCYRTAKRPHTLLDICKRIERAMGRRGGPPADGAAGLRYAPFAGDFTAEMTIFARFKDKLVKKI